METASGDEAAARSAVLAALLGAGRPSSWASWSGASEATDDVAGADEAAGEAAGAGAAADEEGAFAAAATAGTLREIPYLLHRL